LPPWVGGSVTATTSWPSTSHPRCAIDRGVNGL
jgi:hypothetical protein